MSIDQTVSAPRGQQKVLDAWSKRLRGRSFITCEDIDIPAINRELAYISLLGCDDGEFRFRLAGTGLQQVFGCEARGKAANEIEICRGGLMWSELAARCMLRATPVSGMSRLADGSLHFWLRLPLSSDGETADMVLCHDRYLPAEALADPDRAALQIDMSLRRDSGGLLAA
ncbi:MAG: PAS domain-containing protein [Alphaproteobacteria bacterium]|nr:MAG: PAS domain-containing protein [Alphaproteobacteria bacterium]